MVSKHVEDPNALKKKSAIWNSLNPKPIVIGQPVNSMGGQPSPIVSPMTALKTQPNPNGQNKFNPITTQPISAMGVQQALKPPSTPINRNVVNPAPNNMPKPISAPVTGQPINAAGFSTMSANSSPPQQSQSDLNVFTLNEIYKKAQSGQPLANSSAVKNALYDYYKSNPKAKPSSSMSAALLNEIMKKAQSGTAMADPSGEKNAIYNAFKPKQPGDSTVSPSPVTTQPVTQTGGGSTPYVPSTAAPTNNGQANWNSNQSIPDFNGMTEEMIQQIMAGYTSGGQSYDPGNDPVYQSMLQLANKQADSAGLSTMEDMNERGILNSTVTSDRVGQIKQGASDAVIGAIPGLSANFQNQQMNNQNGMQNLLNTVLGAGQFQQQFAEGNRQFDKNFSLDEAATTGQYMPAGAQSIIDSVMTAKKANTVAGLSQAQRDENARIANTGRQQLAAMGIDVSGIGGMVTYDDAMKNLPNLGRSTIIQQQTDLDKSEVMGTQQDSRTQGLVQQVLQAKYNNENGIGNKSGNAKIANEARAQLSALGFDISGIDGNTKYAQAVKNAANLGGATLGAKQLAENIAARKEGNAIAREDLNMKDKQFDRSMTFEEQQAYVDNELKSRGLDIEEVRNSISWFNAESDAEYKLRQKEAGVTEPEAKAATNRALGEVAGSTSPDEAFAYVASQAQNWANAGVDVGAVYDAISAKFPAWARAVTEDSGGGDLGSITP